MNQALISRRALVASAAALAVLPLSAKTAYPNKPIRLIVPFAPGGSVDMVGRIVAEILNKQLGATVVVENIAGAAGVVGAQRVVSGAVDWTGRQAQDWVQALRR